MILILKLILMVLIFKTNGTGGSNQKVPRTKLNAKESFEYKLVSINIF